MTFLLMKLRLLKIKEEWYHSLCVLQDVGFFTFPLHFVANGCKI